jgi:hypothetical protein
MLKLKIKAKKPIVIKVLETFGSKKAISRDFYGTRIFVDKNGKNYYLSVDNKVYDGFPMRPYSKELENITLDIKEFLKDI